MPKQKTDKPLTDKQKIRMLEQDIKEMQRDFKETFSVFDEPKKKRNSKLWIFLVLVLILTVAAYIYMNYFI